MCGWIFLEKMIKKKTSNRYFKRAYGEDKKPFPKPYGDKEICGGD